MPVDDDAAWRPPAAAGGPLGATGDGGHDTDLLPGYDTPVEIARGGDSVVYRARQRALGREVAVKVVLVNDAATLARFERELEITARLGRQHPNIITVIDTGVTRDGHPAIVMDLVERGSLHDVLVASGSLPVPDVVRVGLVIADALSFAHSQGVLHRDVKPQNILVLPTSYVLSDFGISRLADSGHTASVERFSYRHAAPQVLDGHAPTVADDIWSLGSTLHTLLDGRAPFASDDPDDDTALAYLRRARTEQPRPLRRADAPPALLEVIERCLRKDPAERFATAEELHRALVLVETESRTWAPGALPEPVSPPAATASPKSEPEARPGSEPEPDPEPAPEPDPEPELETTPQPEPDQVSPAAPAPEPKDQSEPERPTTPHPSPVASPPEMDPELEQYRPPARSALAHAATVGQHAPLRPGDADSAPTSVAPVASDDDHRPGAASSADASDDPTDEPTGRTRGSAGKRIAAGLLLGCGVGVAVTILMTRQTPPSTPRTLPTTKTSVVPSVSLPSTGVTPLVPYSDPKLEPLLVDIQGRGTSVYLKWQDRTGGKAIFVVLRTKVPTPYAAQQFKEGQTDAVIELPDPDVQQACFRVVAYLDQGVGMSNERCVAPRP